MQIVITEDVTDNTTANCEDEGTTPTDITTVSERLSPRIRVLLDKTDFQKQIIDEEGADFFRNAADFAEHFRGLFVRMTSDQQLLMLLNIAQARVVVKYEYNSVDNNGTTDDDSDDTAVIATDQAIFPLTGINVNTFSYDDNSFPESLRVSNSENSEVQENAEKLYLKGGAGTQIELRLFEEADDSEIVDELRKNNWLINEASLVFNVDQASIPQSDNYIQPYRLYLYNLENGEPLLDQTLLSLPGSTTADTEAVIYGGSLKKVSDGSLQYSFRITQHLNNFLRNNDSSNVPLGLTITPNVNLTADYNGIIAGTNPAEETNVPVAHIISPSSTVLFGGTSSVPEAKRLQLKIIYSDPNITQ